MSFNSRLRQSCCKNAGVSRSIKADELNRMQLPHQYPYAPRLRLVFLVIGAGLLWLAIEWLSCGHVPTGFSLWFGLAPIALGCALGLRCVSFRRYLLLENDSMLLPTGPFQMKAARIKYSSIVRVWRHYLPAAVVLRVATHERTFEILSGLLPNNDSYRALEEFLNIKAPENAARENPRSPS